VGLDCAIAVAASNRHASQRFWPEWIPRQPVFGFVVAILLIEFPKVAYSICRSTIPLEVLSVLDSPPLRPTPGTAATRRRRDRS